MTREQEANGAAGRFQVSLVTGECDARREQYGIVWSRYGGVDLLYYVNLASADFRPGQERVGIQKIAMVKRRRSARLGRRRVDSDAGNTKSRSS